MIRRYDVGYYIGMGVLAGITLLLKREQVDAWTVILCLVLVVIMYGIGFLIQRDMPDLPDCHYFIREDKEVRLCTNQSEIGPEYREINWLQYFWYGLEFYADGLFGEEE